MELYIHSPLFSLTDQIDVTNARDQLLYTASTRFLSLSADTVLKRADGTLVADISRKLLSLHQVWYIDMANGQKAELSTELFHLTDDIIQVRGFDWTLSGNFFQHDYELRNQAGRVLARCHRQWLSLHNGYELDVYDPADAGRIVAVIVALNKLLADRSDQTASSANSGN